MLGTRAHPGWNNRRIGIENNSPFIRANYLSNGVLIEMKGIKGTALLLEWMIS